MKKLTTIMVAMAMVFSVLSLTPKSVSAKVTIMTGTKMTLTIGKSDTIYVKQKKAKFTSSNKKVVTVSKKGDIKAKKTGKAKITVRVGKSKKKVTVTVIPANVKKCTATAVGTNSAKVKWAKAKGAKSYNVYYATSPNGKFTKKSTKTTSFTATNLTQGLTYYFKVKATGNSNTASSKYSAVASVKIWKLEWSDEFNSKKLDTSVWNFETGKTGWGNEELQNYTAGDNIKFDDNNLIIVPRVKVKKGSSNVKDADVSDKNSITSARLYTKPQSNGSGKTFEYGKMEIRAKASKGKGSWSAGWMLGDNIDNSLVGWPKCGEIDIFESMNGSTPMTIHCPYFNNQSSSHGNKFYRSGISQSSASNSFHTYAAVWKKGNPGTIEFFADGVSKGIYDPSKYTVAPVDETWVFDHPFFFILNCAIGGNAAGDVDLTNWASRKDVGDKTVYEDYLYVDYVRVYK